MINQGKTMKISDLPDDLESEILSRVPTKSLAKLQTTCKRWYTLFRDEEFVKKNKKLGKAESMLLSNQAVYSIADDLHGLHNNGGVDPSINFTGKLSSLKDPKDLKIHNIFHCDGLILCTCTTKRNITLTVWNPCTSQTRQIKPRTCYRRGDTFALGYVVNIKSSSSSCHRYKILRSAYYENDEGVRVSEYEMYDLSSNSWRVLDYPTRDYILFSDGMSLNGNTYWVVGNKETGFFMMKFDFTRERYERLNLPFQSFNPEDTTALSVVKDEKLSVLHQNILEFSNVMRIWVTNKIDDEEAKDLSWRSDFVLVVDFDIFDLPSVTNVKSFLLDEENKVAVCCDVDYCDEDPQYQTRIYIVGEDMYKQVYKQTTKGSRLNCPMVLTYVPSLVHIQKGAHNKYKKQRLVK